MLRSILAALLFLCIVFESRADTVVTDISGVDGALLTNVRAHLGLVQAERLDDVSPWRLRQLAASARDEVRQALRPFGYYQPQIDVRLDEPTADGQPWRAIIRVAPGEPIRVARVDIELLGDGAGDEALLAWRAAWPLPENSVLIHERFDSAWRELDRLALARGYFDARFERRRVYVDQDRNTAEVSIRFATGPRYRFGSHSAIDVPFSERLIDRLTIIEPDEPYTSLRLDQQREALVRSGLFERVIVVERRDRDNAVVNLRYRLETRAPNSYRAQAGFGTDTGARIQLGWVRHYLSSRGNRLDTGFGAQQRNSEFVLRTEYQHPRGSQPGDFWTVGGLLRREQDNFRFNDENRREAIFDSFSGRREQAELTLGRLQERQLAAGRFDFGRIEERLFIAVLNESFNAFREASFSEENEALLDVSPELAPFLATTTNSLALGARWRLPQTRGSGFFMEGHILEFQLLAADRSLGSDVSFAQAYLGGRWHRLFGDRHKLLLRGEIGYTEAKTRQLDLALDDRFLDLTITELPERYRFKTGGDRTVRGYGFETLSTNRNGANHILGGSLEYEYRVGNNWSLAAFYDVGNAFNDWGTSKLKRGVGAGFRWYTIIGPIQLDVAQALDDLDRPWRLHFTIGTRLL